MDLFKANILSNALQHFQKNTDVLFEILPLDEDFAEIDYCEMRIVYENASNKFNEIVITLDHAQMGLIIDFIKFEFEKINKKILSDIENFHC